VPTLAGVRERAEEVARLTNLALTSIEAASAVAADVYRELNQVSTAGQLRRFDYEVVEFAKLLALNLGADDIDAELSGSFDLGDVTREARDLLDLLDLANTSTDGVHSKRASDRG
jgi:hypothetical protein